MVFYFETIEKQHKYYTNLACIVLFGVNKHTCIPLMYIGQFISYRKGVARWVSASLAEGVLVVIGACEFESQWGLTRGAESSF